MWILAFLLSNLSTITVCISVKNIDQKLVNTEQYINDQYHNAAAYTDTFFSKNTIDNYVRQWVILVIIIILLVVIIIVLSSYLWIYIYKYYCDMDAES